MYKHLEALCTLPIYICQGHFTNFVTMNICSPNSMYNVAHEHWLAASINTNVWRIKVWSNAGFQTMRVNIVWIFALLKNSNFWVLKDDCLPVAKYNVTWKRQWPVCFTPAFTPITARNVPMNKTEPKLGFHRKTTFFLDKGEQCHITVTIWVTPA